jgi:chromosome segregation ATPase
MQDAVGRVNGDFARFEEESRRARDAAAEDFSSQVRTLREELDKVDTEMTGLKARAIESVSEKLDLFEADFAAGLDKRSADIENRLAGWHEELEGRLAGIAAEGAEERRKAETRINEELRKTLADQGERLVSELERLKTETVAFEEGIREEMKAADETRRSFNEQLAQDLEAARNAAETETKTQIGQYSLSMSETLRQNQRELEEQLREIDDRLETQIADLRTLMENSRRSIEDWQGQYNAQMRDMDTSMEEIRRRSRDMAAENDDRIAQARAALDDIRKEITAQAKLFDRTNALKLELEHRVEDLNGDMNRLDQRKHEITEIERQFTQIKRLEDDVNAKMTRFLSEKRRVEVMETDFNRLLQTSQAVEEKLAQVSSSDDTLQAIQVQIRRLEDAIKETEEKYQRVERKSQALEETNAGIDRNFKALQESEAVLEKNGEEITLLGKETEALRASIEALSSENEKARDAADKLSTLDESLTLIEKRIAEMNIAREWLANTDTELQSLNKDTQTLLKLSRSLLDRESGKTAARGGKGKPADDGTPPRDRDNIIKLRRQGWTVEQLAEAYKISMGEVELILELGLKD